MSKFPVLFLAVSLGFAAKAPEPPALRLGTSAAPTRYAIDLTVVPNQDRFQGIADIEVRFAQPTALLWLNTTQIDIKTASLHLGGETLTANLVPGGKDFSGFAFPREVTGTAILHVTYEGRISRDSSAGIFQLKDRDRWYVYTQFEPTDARRAFPCFDEPGFKTPWEITLHVPASDMAVANTPVASESPEADGMKVVKFATTKPLPTYLVAVAVGPFDAVSAGKVGKTPLRVIVPKGRGNEAKFAAESIPQLLKLLEEYFGYPFPYEKLDSVVMPISNFAMENVGLITYGRSLLLANPGHDSVSRQRQCAVVVAHEMAHQWFGDSVTTAWWNDIWLNEAFATWMEDKIVGEWKPQWGMDVTQVEDRLGAMELDSLRASRQIRQPIVSNDDIANAFDGITYQKGAAVIRMFEHWLGSDVFRNGVRIYIKRHADGNATTADFEAAISSAAGKNISPAFNSFLDQAGVPVISASLNLNGNRPALQLSQERSLLLGSPAATPQSWQIPICVKYGVHGEVYHECELLADPNSRIVLKQANQRPDWVLLNQDEVGYYRVSYKGNLLEQLLSDRRALTVAENVGILGDMKALVESGQMSPKMALSVLPQFSGDPNRQVVESAFDVAAIVKGDAVPDELQAAGSTYIRRVFGKRALELGWEAKPDEDENTALLRHTLVPKVAAKGEEKQLIERAQQLAQDWLVNHNAIKADLAGPVLNVAAQFGDSKLFDALLADGKKEQDPRVRETVIRALASFRNPELAQRALGLLLTNDFDPRESFYPLLFGPLKHPETRALPFEFVQTHLDELLSKLPREVGGDFAALLPETGRAFCDTQHRDEVQEFFQDRVKQYTGGPRNLAKTIESINVCMAQKKVLGPELEQALRSSASL